MPRLDTYVLAVEPLLERHLMEAFVPGEEAEASVCFADAICRASVVYMWRFSRSLRLFTRTLTLNRAVTIASNLDVLLDLQHEPPLGRGASLAAEPLGSPGLSSAPNTSPMPYAL